MKKHKSILSAWLLLLAGINVAFAQTEKKPDNFSHSVKSVQLNCAGTTPILSIVFDISRFPPNDKRELLTELILVRVDDGAIRRYVLKGEATPSGPLIYTPNGEFAEAIEKDNVLTVKDPQIVFPASDDLKATFSLIVRSWGKKDKEPVKNDQYFQISVMPACLAVPDNLPAPDKAAIGIPTPTPGVLPFDDFVGLNKKLKKAEDDEISNIKANISYDGSRSGLKDSKYGTADIRFQPRARQLLRGHGAISWRPVYFALKYSNKESEPVRSLEIGTSATHYWLFRDDGERGPETSAVEGFSRLFTGFETKISVKSESDFTFGKWNMVGSGQVAMPIKFIPYRFVGIRLTPFVGFEVGRKINLPDDVSVDFKERTIMRPFFGAEMRLIPLRFGKTRLFEITANYKNLILMKPELRYRVNGTTLKKEVEGQVTSPQFFVSSKATLLPDTKFSPFVEFSYGREPIEYILVNRRWRVGIEFNWDYTNK